MTTVCKHSCHFCRALYYAGHSEEEEPLRGIAITAKARPKQLQSRKQGSPAKPGPTQGSPAGLAGPAVSQARHHQKLAGPAWGAPAGLAGSAAAQSRQRHRPDGAAAVQPGLMQGMGAGPAAAAGPSSAAASTSQQQERGARVGSGVPAAARPGAGSPADQGMRNKVWPLSRASAADGETVMSRAGPPTNGLAPAAAPAAAIAMASQPPSKYPTPGAPAAAGTSRSPNGTSRLHSDGSAQPTAAPDTPGQGVKRPLEQLLVSPRRRMTVGDRARQLRQQEQYPGEREEAAAAATQQAAAEAAGLGLLAAGPSAWSGGPCSAAACTAAATAAHVAAQAPAEAAPAEATPAAATPARPQVSKRKAPSEEDEARSATQQEPTLPAASPAATSAMPDGTPRAALSASEKASAVEQDALPRTRRKRGHGGTPAVDSGQDLPQSDQHLVTPASWPGFHAAAQAGTGSTSQPGTSQAGSGRDVPARQEQQASRRGSARATGSRRALSAQSKQATGRGLHSSSSKATAPTRGTRGITPDDDCIDLSKLSTPVPRDPQTLISKLAANNEVIDLT